MARKAKRDTVEQDQMPARTPEEIFEDHYPDILAARTELDKKTAEAKTANSAYRACLKAFKRGGGQVDAMTAALALRKREPEDVTREWMAINTYARLMKLPIGTQLGLWDQPAASIATQIENAEHANGNGHGKVKAPTREMLRAAKKAGRAASAAGKFESANPYEDGSPEFLAFAAGFRANTEERVKAMGKPKGGEVRRGALQ